MRKILTFLFVLTCFGIAQAEDSFGTRVMRAKAVEDSPDGKTYQQQLWKQIGDYTAATMQRCFKKGTKADTSAFTLIGDVLPNCSLDNVEVRPKTKMSECFAQSLLRVPFPHPAARFGDDGMPFEIDMKITP